MALILAHRTDRPSDALVLYSALKSGGFNPEIFNFHHGFLAMGYVEALGGFRIMLPEDEVFSAREFLESTEAINDHDPIKPKPLRDVLYASILSVNPLWCVLLLPPAILLLLTLVWIAMNRLWEPTSIIFLLLEYSSTFCFIAILAHAKYVALPKIRKTKP